MFEPGIHKCLGIQFCSLADPVPARGALAEQNKFAGKTVWEVAPADDIHPVILLLPWFRSRSKTNALSELLANMFYSGFELTEGCFTGTCETDYRAVRSKKSPCRRAR